MPKKKRGRPLVYTGIVEKYIVSLLRSLGNATHVRLVLNARAPKKGQRDLTIVPKALGITPPTIGKIAKRHKIVLPKGRPVKKKAA